MNNHEDVSKREKERNLIKPAREIKKRNKDEKKVKKKVPSRSCW